MTSSHPSIGSAEHLSTLREKNAWICLVSTVAVYVPYFAYVVFLMRSGDFNNKSVYGLWVNAVCLQAVAVGVVSAVATLRQPREPKDERDLALEARSYRASYWTLSGLCMLLVIGLPLLNLTSLVMYADRTFALLLSAQAVLFCYVCGEAVKYLALAIGYRRSV